MTDVCQSVLLVEDDQDLKDIIEQALHDASFEVVAAEEATGALNALARQPFHIVLLDLILPGMSGTEICSEIRAQSSIPVLLMSAKGRMSDVLWGLHLGANDYVVKPFDVRELIARIEVLLRRSNRAEGWSMKRSFRHGRLSVDFGDRVAIIDGRHVRLTPTETRLMACLASDPGALVSREEILSRVWGWDSVGDKQYLKLYISYLRKKLEHGSGPRGLLVSERGVGYRLNLVALETREPASTADVPCQESETVPGLN